MDIFEGKHKRYCKRLTKFGRNIVLRIKPRAAMFVVRFANLSLARYLTNPRVIAWLPALKGALEPGLLTEILLFWATLNCFLQLGQRASACTVLTICLFGCLACVWGFVCRLSMDNRRDQSLLLSMVCLNISLPFIQFLLSVQGTSVSYLNSYKVSKCIKTYREPKPPSL